MMDFPKINPKKLENKNFQIGIKLNAILEEFPTVVNGNIINPEKNSTRTFKFGSKFASELPALVQMHGKGNANTTRSYLKWSPQLPHREPCRWWRRPH